MSLFRVFEARINRVVMSYIVHSALQECWGETDSLSFILW